MLLQMAMIVKGNEWLCEIFDGQGRLSLLARTIVNLHTVSAFMDAEKALHDHISFGILGDDLQVKLQGMLRLKWGQLHGAQTNKNVGPYWENPTTSCRMCIYFSYFMDNSKLILWKSGRYF